MTETDVFPLPRKDDLIEKLGKAKYITVLDPNKGYWQVKVAENSRAKMAFITHLGLFQFKTILFGLRNAPAMFQRLINNVPALDTAGKNIWFI